MGIIKDINGMDLTEADNIKRWLEYTEKLYKNRIPYNYTVEVTNRFKGIDLIGREPEELWMERHNIVQQAMVKIIPKKKKSKKGKMVV